MLDRVNLVIMELIMVIMVNKVIMMNTMAMVRSATVCMLILNLHSCVAFVLPDQEVKLEVRIAMSLARNNKQARD